MPRKSVVLPPPTVLDPLHRELAMGIHAIWASALYASGADVFAPPRPLDTEPDPFAAVTGMTGTFLLHDGAPEVGPIDAIVLTELRTDDDGWRCRARILEPDGSEIVLPARRHRKLSAPLDLMTATLHALTSMLELEMPPDFGWRQLLGANTIAGGLRTLRAQGRAALRHAEEEPPSLLH
jgi:hypothetical protein